ncbi:flavin reductase family protein [Pontibacillus yanchengensis]|uniref:Flavin reductase family protein n=2 Tax=Pontibacillus yanchengensis TaxID=462910 RepID=A0ACC7VCD3_9BACI|nr:flavin reductase family protein [Pontibacillus yanchengensis]MYL35191.1 flavin reductase family protein [Pontibacillus yanchengensis]MYL52442.1 flavin reductase family protein [Pontibacillus yanchengensis]
MPNEKAIRFEASQLEKKEMYKLMSGSVVPRPIAWVSSKSREGILNIAPFSFFTVASPEPPILAISIGQGAYQESRDTKTKDTLTNILDLEEFVINVVPESLANAMHESSKPYHEQDDEFKKAGLTPQGSTTIEVPSVLESPIAFECKLEQTIQFGDNHMVFGRVKQVHVHEDIYLEGYKTDINQWKPLARLAGDYASLSNPFTLPKE